MIPNDALISGAILYEPRLSILGVLSYEVVGVKGAMVDLAYTDGYNRVNRGKGANGFSTHKDNLKNLFTTEHDALNSLMDMIEKDLREKFKGYDFHILPMRKDVEHTEVL